MFEDSDPGDVSDSVASLRRDRDALVADKERKLAEICALKERLAALEAPVPEKPSFPVRALRHRHQVVGLFVLGWN